MSFESSYFNTEEYGTIGLTTSPIDESGETDVGTNEQLSQYDFSSNDDKTWGLATKFYILSALANHNSDASAHEELFQKIFSNYSDAVVSGGKFLFNSVNDRKGNAIYANGMITYDDGAKRGYVVTASSRGASFDELSGKVDAESAKVEGILKNKQDKLIAGDNVFINPRTNEISATDTIYELPSATATRLGGVFLDGKLDVNSENPVSNKAISEEISKKQNVLSDGVGISLSNDIVSVKFGKIDDGERLPVAASDAKAKLAGKQPKISFDENHFENKDGTLSLKFGSISDGSSSIVSGGELRRALDAKQDNISFDSQYFTTSDKNEVSLKFEELSEGSAGLVKSSDIKKAIDEVASKIDEKAFKIVTDTGLSAVEKDGKTVLSIDFGTIAESSEKPVRGKDINSLLSGKQDTIKTGQSMSISDDNVLSLTVDSKIEENGQNPVLGKTLYSAFSSAPFSIKDGVLEIAKAGNDTSGVVVVDDKLDADSSNPVRNSAITRALGGKQKALTVGDGLKMVDSTISADIGTIESGSSKVVSSGELFSKFEKCQPLLKEGSGISLVNDTVDGTMTISVTSSFNEATPDNQIAGIVYLTDKAESNSQKAITAGGVHAELLKKQDNLQFSDDLTLRDGKVTVNYGSISADNTALTVKGSEISDALKNKQDRLTFSSEFLCSTDGNVSLIYSDTIERGQTTVPSQDAILNTLEEYQKSLSFSTSDFVTSEDMSLDPHIDVSVRFGDIEKKTDGLVSATDLSNELSKKQPLLYFSSPLTSAYSEDGKLEIGLGYGSISENSPLPVKASVVKSELDKKQNLLTAVGGNITITPSSTDDGTSTLVISAKDTVYSLPTATVSTIGGVKIKAEISENGDFVVPSRTLYSAFAAKQKKLTLSTGLTSDGDGSIGLDYGKLSSYSESEANKPLCCKDAHDALLLKSPVLCAGDNIRITKDDSTGLWYISEEGYKLMPATTETSGGVYFSESKLDSDGNYTVPAKTVYASLEELRKSIAGANGISVSEGDASTTLPYFQPKKTVLSVDFGSISKDNTTKPVKGSDVDAALSEKQDTIAFDTDGSFSKDDYEKNRKISIDFATEITESSVKPAKTSDICKFIRTNSGKHYIYEHVTSHEASETIDIYDEGVNTIDVHGHPTSSLSFGFPAAKNGLSRNFYVTLVCGDTSSVKEPPTTLKISFPSEFEYYSASGETPFEDITLKSIGTDVYEFHIYEIQSGVFMVSRKLLTTGA